MPTIACIPPWSFHASPESARRRRRGGAPLVDAMLARASLAVARVAHARPRDARRRSTPDFVASDGSMDEFLVPELSLRELDVKEIIGSGAFSDVHAAFYAGAPAIAKRFRASRGRDVESFYADELESARALRTCEGVAPFLGACGSAQWLVWDDVGRGTLARALEAAEPFDVVREAIGTSQAGITDEETLAFIGRSLGRATREVHAFDFIHRDVKPANALMDERNGRFILCDVGACADARTGRNMDGEAIFDPTYGAPEQFRVVARRRAGGFPNIGGLFGKKTSAQEEETLDYEATGEPPTTLLDAYSLGITLLQVGVPSLRLPGAIARARRDIDACGGDVELWRRQVCVPGVNDWSLVDETDAWETIVRLTKANPSERWNVERALEEDAFLAGK